MGDADRTPAGAPDLRGDLLRSGGSVVGLIALVAALFWGIGALWGEDDPLAADGAAVDTTDGEQGDDGDGGEDTAEDGAVDGGAADDAATDGDAEDPDADTGGEPAADADADGDGDIDADGDTDAAETDDADEDAPAVDPGSVSVQVLDGFKEDGGTAADEVAALLGDSGYQVVARNDALTYEVTTVLYNPGSEAAARQVAAELGGADVREQPGNLSTAVDLHVVVGRDRG